MRAYAVLHSVCTVPNGATEKVIIWFYLYCFRCLQSAIIVNIC